MTRDHWIAAGFDALDHDGDAGISAGRLARRLQDALGLLGLTPPRHHA